ncbi:hypothetical protein KAZ93_03890 [Patescibacteria group bacterium]|nr:hypothetical protein [Patescibacteria group bacterium]
MVRDALEALFIVLGGNLDSIPATVELRGAMPEGSLLKIQCTTSSDIIVSTHPNNISNLFFPSTVSQDIIACLLNLYDAISQDNINHPRGNE